MRGLGTHTHTKSPHTEIHTRVHPYSPSLQLRQNLLHPTSRLLPSNSCLALNCLSKRTNLENKTVQLTNKITCCLHLAVAIKALMTSGDGLLMWCLKAYQRIHNKIAPHKPLWLLCQPHRLSVSGSLCCLLCSAARKPLIRRIEMFIVRTVETNAALQVTWF